MGKLIAFPGVNPEVSQEVIQPRIGDFAKFVASDDTKLATERALGLLYNNPYFALPALEAKPIEDVQVAHRNNTMFTYSHSASIAAWSQKPERILLVPTSFSAQVSVFTEFTNPDIELSEGEVYTKAFSAAAVYFRAYAAFLTATRNPKSEAHRFTKAYEGSRIDALWPYDVRERNLSVAYRFAGQAMQQAVGVNDITFSQSDASPQPPYIAGMLNPLPFEEAKQFHV